MAFVRMKDIRWHILACLILVLSYAAIAYCFYLPVRAKTVASMENLAMEAVDNNIGIIESEIESYHNRFVIGDFNNIETDFNKTSYATKMDGAEYKISTGDYFLNNGDTSMYVFFYNPNATEDKMGGYIDLAEVINTSEFEVIIFTDASAIKYSTAAEILQIGNMNRLLEDDYFITNLNENYDNGYSKVYYLDDVQGVLSIKDFHGLYYSIFIPLESAFFSINWIETQAIIFYVVGIIILLAMLVILILGCRRASVLLRVERHAVNTNHAIIIRTRKDGSIIFTNTAFKTLFDFNEKPDVNNFIEIYSGKPIVNFFKNKKTIECRCEINGVTRFFQLTPIGVVSSYYLVGSDITEQHQRLETLEKLNGKNEHTGCSNNFSLATMFPTILANAETDIAFVEINIHKYYELISVFGQQAYHLLLTEILKTIEEEFEHATVYHVQDEKFIVLVANIDIKDVISMSNQLLERLRKPFMVKSNNMYVRMKIAIYNLPLDQMSNMTLDIVKTRLELAYNNIVGFRDKDVIVYVEAMDGALTSFQVMEEDLKKGIQDEEFEMYLQPQLDTHSNKVVGFESLIRWNNPKYINRSPQAFIELAEQRGYILDIGRYAIKESMRIAKELEKYDVSVSLNLSPIQIMQVGFVNELVEIYKTFNLKPGSIALEITENVLMENFVLVNEKIKLLRAAGFQVHLDDFCTGYSSMAYLTEFEIDALKIDYAFAKHVDTNKVSYSIVSCICTLAKELGLEVICEGVETDAQKEIIKKLGCKTVQGFFVSKAMPFNQAVEFLEKKNTKKGDK